MMKKAICEGAALRKTGDKYLPSYLIYAKFKNEIFHILFAIDEPNKNVRIIITTYRPDKEKWGK